MVGLFHAPKEQFLAQPIHAALPQFMSEGQFMRAAQFIPLISQLR
jgi:hypothetical protein